MKIEIDDKNLVIEELADFYSVILFLFFIYILVLQKLS